MHELADAHAVHLAADLGDPPDPLVAEAQRIAGRLVALDEEPELRVEALVAEGRGASPELQLGALADPADDGGRARLVRPERALLDLDEAARSRSGDEELARHARICIRSTSLS